VSAISFLNMVAIYIRSGLGLILLKLESVLVYEVEMVGLYAAVLFIGCCRLCYIQVLSECHTYFLQA
jgi:hypothetical protein